MLDEMTKREQADCTRITIRYASHVSHKFQANNQPARPLHLPRQGLALYHVMLNVLTMTSDAYPLG